VPTKLAEKLSLTKGMERQYNTANGVILAHSTVLDSVSIGPIIVSNVRASISPGLGGDEVLLGMSVLKRIEFTQRGDTLILKPFTATTTR